MGAADGRLGGRDAPAVARPAANSEARIAALERRLADTTMLVSDLRTEIAVRFGEGPTKQRPGSVEAAVQETVRTVEANGAQGWRCGSCTNYLGFYNPVDDVLRFRQKNGMYSYVHVGVNGWIMIPCWSCGELNRQDWVPGPEAAQEETER